MKEKDYVTKAVRRPARIVNGEQFPEDEDTRPIRNVYSVTILSFK